VTVGFYVEVTERSDDERKELLDRSERTRNDEGGPMMHRGGNSVDWLMMCA